MTRGTINWRFLRWSPLSSQRVQSSGPPHPLQAALRAPQFFIIRLSFWTNNAPSASFFTRKTKFLIRSLKEWSTPSESGWTNASTRRSSSLKRVIVKLIKRAPKKRTAILTQREVTLRLLFARTGKLIHWFNSIIAPLYSKEPWSPFRSQKTSRWSCRWPRLLLSEISPAGSLFTSQVCLFKFKLNM